MGWNKLQAAPAVSRRLSLSLKPSAYFPSSVFSPLLLPEYFSPQSDIFFSIQEIFFHLSDMFSFESITVMTAA